MHRGEALTSLFFLVLAAAIVAGVWQLEFWTSYGPGPAFAAYLVAAVLAIIAVLLLLQGRQQRAVEAGAAADLGGLLRAGSAVLATVGFVLALPTLGFIAATVIFMAVMLLAIQRRPLLPSLLAIAVTTGVAYGVFVLWLAIPLPRGIVGI